MDQPPARRKSKDHGSGGVLHGLDGSLCNQETEKERDRNAYAPSIIPRSIYGDGEPKWMKVQDGRVLRVFMSSTFRDMQKERDEFFVNAEKRLKDYASKIGLVLVFVDLRWGLTNEISENGRVVICCLEAIEECPYFLCTLGSRYGWSPNHEKSTEWHPDTDKRFPFLKEMRGLSVTDYEIVHGALNKEPISRRAFFYSRDERHAVKYVAESEEEKGLYLPVNQRDKENQEYLKRKISENFRIKIYQTPQELVKMTIDDIMEAIGLDFGPKVEAHPEDAAHKQFMIHRLIGLEGRDVILSSIKKETLHNLEKDACGITLVSAESGIGKSTIMCGLVRDLSEDEDSNLVVISHFIGCSNMSNYVENLTERVARKLAENRMISLNFDSEQGKDAIAKGLDYILRIASMNRENKKAVLVIDAINQLVNSYQYPHVHNLEWLPKKSYVGFSIVVSTINTHQTFKAAAAIANKVIIVNKLDGEGIRKAAIGFFRRYRHPLYLHIILDELRIFGIYEKVDYELNTLLETKGVVNLFNLVMSRWENKYGVQIVRLTVGILHLSRIGLNENELEKYIEFRMSKMDTVLNHAKWKSFLFVLMESLFVRNGRYAFSHQLLAESIQERYFKDEYYFQSEVKEYGLWMLHEYNDSVGDESEIAEVCHALFTAKEWDWLAKYLQRKKVVEFMLRGGYRYEFLKCWRSLNENGFDHKACYVEMAKELSSAGYQLVTYFRDVGENRFLIPIIEARVLKDDQEGSKAQNLHFLGVVYENLGMYENALRYYNESLAIRLHVFGEEHPDVAASYNNLGNVYDDLGRRDEALESHFTSLDIRLKLFGEVHPDVAKSFTNIGHVYRTLWSFQRSLKNYHKSLEIRLKLFGDSHPDIAASYVGIGSVHYTMEMYDESLDNYHKALKILLKAFGEMHASVALPYIGLGNIYQKREEYKEALSFFEKAFAIQLQAYGEAHPSVASSYNSIARVYQDMNMFETASNYFQKCLEIRMNIFGEMHPRTGDIFYNLGAFYQLQMKHHEALDMFTKARNVYEKFYGSDSPETIDAMDRLAVVQSNIQ